MKWLIIINKYIPEIVGGNVIYVERFIKALNEAGHQVTLLVTTSKKDFVEYEKINNVEIHRVYVENGATGPLRFSNRRLLNEKLDELLENNTYDIVNTHTACLLTLKFLRERKKKYNFKLISTFHAVVTYEIIFDFQKYITFQAFNLQEIILFPLKVILMYIFEYVTLKNTDSVVVMSEYVKGTIKSFFGKKFLDKVLITGIGVTQSEYPQISREEAREKLNLNKDENIFITVRRLALRMGLFNLIKAFSQVKDENSKLFIIGKGELYNKLDNLIKKLNLEDKVKLLGFVDNESLNYYYCAADCFILPTEQLEGFGIVTIEALNYNLPVIGTPKGATPEILNKFAPELITKSHRADDISEKINYYIENKDNYDKINYKELVNIEYNWNSLINMIIKENINSIKEI